MNPIKIISLFVTIIFLFCGQTAQATKVNVDDFFSKQRPLAQKLIEAQKKYQKVLQTKPSLYSNEKQRSLVLAAAYFLGASTTCVGMLGDILEFYRLTPENGKNFKEYSDLFARNLAGSASMLEQALGFVQAAISETKDKDVAEALGEAPASIAELISYLRELAGKTQPGTADLEEPAKSSRKRK